MPWNDDGNKSGPWGSGGDGKKSNSQQPNIEEIIKKGQEQFRKSMPGGFGSGQGLLVILVLAVVVWMGSGFYKLNEGEQAVVLRFGSWVGTTNAGLRYHWPYPIEKVIIKKVTEVRRITSSDPSASISSDLRDLKSTNSMLTGDENILQVDYVVIWFIKDLGQYLFNTVNPDEAIKIAADSIMREIVSKTPMAAVTTKDRGSIGKEAQVKLQKLCDEYKLGVEIISVQPQEAVAHTSVLEAFKDVQRAKTDLETKVNAAEAYKNQVVPVAEGAAARIIQEAEAYKAVTVARAEGDASRFDAVLTQYRHNPDVVRTRIHVDALTKTMTGSNITYFGSGTKNASGVLPYMALPAVKEKQPKTKTEDEGK